MRVLWTSFRHKYGVFVSAKRISSNRDVGTVLGPVLIKVNGNPGECDLVGQKSRSELVPRRTGFRQLEALKPFPALKYFYALDKIIYF